MVQITASAPMNLHDEPWEQMQEEGFIQLDLLEAAELITTLSRYVKEEAIRRRDILKDQV
jgi:hypothetical protein